MILKKKFIFIVFFILISILLLYFLIFSFQKKSDESKAKAKMSITINLLTSVHPKLSWTFIPVKPKIEVTPGQVTIVEYTVENNSKKSETGIATFSYYPREFGDYIVKMNCFCYDAQNLKPNEKSSYSLVMLIDPAVTKNNKTKNTKEITMQFTFFDYKDYKDKGS
ncbi:MAG: cytochrome c oxidase assembly protein subunit 11 [Pelagibacterales bacterium]|nr:cytochrome c oxidase assembly protein subunit 11 [Pelagibacterales bacterium]